MYIFFLALTANSNRFDCLNYVYELINDISWCRFTIRDDVDMLKLHFTWKNRFGSSNNTADWVVSPYPKSCMKYAREVLQIHIKSINHIYLCLFVPIIHEICKRSLAIAQKMDNSYLFVSPCRNQSWNMQGKSCRCTENQ